MTGPEHLEAMADRIIAAVPEDQEIHYVEIGCGEADFLKLVMERAKGRCVSAIGLDPSYSGTEKLPKGAQVHRTFFGSEQLPLIPEATNVICSRHTIEHVADVQSFVEALTLPVSTSTRKLFIETPDANWILKNTAFQDFFYEHCSIYTPESMALVLKEYGLTAKTTPVYDGQYMWTEAQLSSDASSSLPQISPTLAKKYIAESAEMLCSWVSFIQEQSKEGPVAIWGAASKGVTFSLLLEELGSKIDCAIDLNEAKQGRFLPISGARVVSPQEAQGRGVKSIIIMNPNYRDEIIKMASDMGWAAEFATLNG